MRPQRRCGRILCNVVGDVEDEVSGQVAPSDIPVGDQRRWSASQVLIASSWGFAIAAVVLSVYVLVRRVPDGLVSDRLAAATQVLGGSLGAVAVTALALSAGGLAVLAGRAVAVKAASALAVIAVITSFMFLSSLLRRATESVSGPGARPVAELAQMSWLMLAVAAVLLVAAATIAQKQTRHPVMWPRMLPFIAAGVVVALAAGAGLVALTQRAQPRATTATAIAVPELPATLGTDTAYTLSTKYSRWLVPAGPGFVLDADGAITAYNGADGERRWSFPYKLFPAGCELWAIRSTGIAPDAVVIAECNHDAGYGKPRTDPFLVGLDAMTGELLWTLDNDWSLRSRILLPSNTVPVVSSERNELGSLDPRTGSVRWTWSFDESDKQCSDTGYVGALTGAVMYADPCGAELRVHVFDAVSGADRVIVGTVPQEFSDGQWVIEPHAIDGTVAVVRIRGGSSNGSAILSIDTAASRVDMLPVEYLSDGDSARVWQYPGPVLQINDGSRPEHWVDLYRLSDRSTLHVVGLDTSNGGSYAPHTSMMWAQVGTQWVTAAGLDEEYNNLLVSVSPDGTVTRRPSPCGKDVGSVLSVPGAVLVVCQRLEGRTPDGYDILGLRAI